MECKTCKIGFSSSEYMHVIIDKRVKYLPQSYCDMECLKTQTALKRMNNEESTVLKNLEKVVF